MLSTIRIMQQNVADKIWFRRRTRQLKRQAVEARRELQFWTAMSSPNGEFASQIEDQRKQAQAKVDNVKQEAQSLF